MNFQATPQVSQNETSTISTAETQPAIIEGNVGHMEKLGDEGADSEVARLALFVVEAQAHTQAIKRLYVAALSKRQAAAPTVLVASSMDYRVSKLGGLGSKSRKAYLQRQLCGELAHLSEQDVGTSSSRVRMRRGREDRKDRRCRGLTKGSKPRRTKRMKMRRKKFSWTSTTRRTRTTRKTRWIMESNLNEGIMGKRRRNRGKDAQRTTNPGGRLL
ncbi:hypothetical protein FN846DRAFT_311043 [Sphaerosporella brunnea]|uniref:Uncharacterized protein n=1 Tax=Sphaerosporella brunnea TaxID=1250544 RepID=A0A5J5F7B9_9PEZI|nr:hypothetical protein FN846DRAFT_311043 [Sphaerosporella brunnea]